jgi:hypothetical protein
MPTRTRLVAGLSAWVLTRAGLAAWLAAGAGAGDGVMGLTHTWTERMLAGDSPYDPVGVAYPPLAMALFVLPALGVDAGGYAVTFPLLVLAADAAGLAIAVAADRAGRSWTTLAYALAVAAAGPVLLLWRYDLLPAVAHLTAAWLLLRGRPGWSWASLGVGIALKPYLAVAVPLWALWALRTGGRGPALRGIGIAALPSAVALALFAPLARADVALPYLFQLRRGLNVESLPAAVVAEAGAAEAVFSDGCLCWERAGPAAAWAGPAGTLAALVVLAALAVAVWRRPTREAAVAASAAAVVGLIGLSPVFSPQYVVWPLPVLILVANRWAVTAAAAAAAVAAAGYPGMFASLIAYDGTGRALILGRAGLLAAACWFAWPSKSASSGCPTSASPPSSTP